MLFYETMTTEQERTFYVQMLQMMGSLSNLFSESPKPFLVSRATENIFCLSHSQHLGTDILFPRLHLACQQKGERRDFQERDTGHVYPESQAL